MATRLADLKRRRRRLARRRGPGQLFGMRAEEFRADSRQAATRNWSLRSIECEFDHLFLVEACSTILNDLPGSHIAKERFARGNALGAWAWLARRKS
jgi:hypothetical protein